MHMQEQFGHVTVTYDEETALLQQPRPEDLLVEQLLEEGFDCKRAQALSFPVLYHLSHLRGNLTEWLPVKMTDTVLEFGADSGQLTGGLAKKAEKVICLEESVSRCRLLAKRWQTVDNISVFGGSMWTTLETLPRFDWIVAPGVLTEAHRYFTGEYPEQQALNILKQHLKPDGHLVLAADNRFGLKYWAGAKEPHTGQYFDSLEGKATSFSKRELETILIDSGLTDYQFYYPYPERWFPMSIYSDQWLPKKGELNQNLRNFEGERMVLFDEEQVYDELIKDGRFPEFSNTYLMIAGPERKDCPVYVKYSNDRAERFMIRTDILGDAAHRQVRKVPVSAEAVSHVKELKHWEEVLDVQYREAGLRANRCELKDGAAYFEFLHGRTFEELLDEKRQEKDYAGLAAELQRYRKLLTAALAKEIKPFAKSQEFIEMFGNPDFTKAYSGASINNLDWIFGNLMETKDGTQIIDYEWTFPVQVPVEYLIWRAVSLYLNSREDVKHLGLMAQMGISEAEEAVFTEMEHHFQLWLLDGTVTIGAQYLHTAGRTITREELLRQVKKNRIQIYPDCGSGFSEGTSYWVETEADKEGNVRLELLLPADIRGLRLDPAETPCLVKIKRILGELGGSYNPGWSHNGRELEQQGILYTTTDPQIVISGLVEGTGRLYVELTIQELYPDTAYACMHLLNRVRAAERLTNSMPFKFLKKLKNILKGR